MRCEAQGRERERERASSRGHTLWIPNDTTANATGTVAPRGNAQGRYAVESNTDFNAPFLSPSPFLSLPISLSPSRRQSHGAPPPPPTQTHTHRKDSSPILRAHSSMRSLFSGCVVPEVAILPWPPLFLSKACNQCAALCTRMSQDARAKTQQNFWWTALAQSSANQVLLMSLSSYVSPFEANKVFAVWHILLGSHKAAVGSIHKVSWKNEEKKKKQCNQSEPVGNS